MYRLANPFVALGVPPSLISLLGVVLFGGAVWLAQLPVLAAVLIVVGAVADGLDGAVALICARDTVRGAAVDAICDRIGDALLMVVLWRAGAPVLPCLLAAACSALHEYIRVLLRSLPRDQAGSRSANVPDHGDVTLTVAERPTRVIVVVAFLLAFGTTHGGLHHGTFWLTAGAWLSLALSVTGLVQLGWSLRRTLSP